MKEKEEGPLLERGATMKINRDFHDFEHLSNFREQLALLTLEEILADGLLFLRRFIKVGNSGAVGFAGEADNSFATKDSFSSWQALDDAIKNGVSGTFHTHPAGMNYFSQQDIIVQNGLAKANGERILFHGVQALDHDFRSKFVAVNMINNHIIRREYEIVKDYLNRSFIILPFFKCPSINIDNEIVTLSHSNTFDGTDMNHIVLEK